MNDFNQILNKYNNQSKTNNSNQNTLKENNSNNKEIISNNNIQNNDENQVNSLKNNNKSNIVRNSDYLNPNDVNNNYIEKKKDEKDIDNSKNNKKNELSSLQNNKNSSNNYIQSQNIDNNNDENQTRMPQEKVNKNQKDNNEKLLIKDLVLTNQTITEQSKIDLEEFKDGNIVEKLINCPQNNSISLNCIEANKIALVIINLLETKNDLENEIEEEKKKNEIRLDKLKIDFERQKKNFKLNYDKKEINILDALNKIKGDIEEEKKFLDDNVKSYNLWDKVSIENQRTKEIKESIKKKLETLK
jgi:hypothetical protein